MLKLAAQRQSSGVPCFTPHRGYRTDVGFLMLTSMLRKVVDASPGKAAIVQGNRRIRYDELDGMAGCSRPTILAQRFLQQFGLPNLQNRKRRERTSDRENACVAFPMSTSGIGASASVVRQRPEAQQRC